MQDFPSPFLLFRIWPVLCSLGRRNPLLICVFPSLCIINLKIQSDFAQENWRALRSSIVSDAFDRLGIKGKRILGGFSPVIRGQLAVGPTFPIRVVSNPRTKLEYRPQMIDAISKAPRGSVIVVSSEMKSCSSWGGLVNRSASKRSFGGVLVDGAIRDIEDIAKSKLPVFHRAITPVSGSGRLDVLSAGLPVKVDSLTISQGDLIVADTDGVAIIKKELMNELLKEAEKIISSERAITRSGTYKS